MARAREFSTVDIAVAGAVTEGRAGERLADLEGMLEAGVRWFTDDGDSVASAGLLQSALQVLRGHGAIISEHAEDASLTAGAIMHDGEVADRRSEWQACRSWPRRSSSPGISRWRRRPEGPCTFSMSAPTAAVELIAAAKQQGLPVTAEATPHHLTFDHTELKSRDPRFKMKPPLRTDSDVAAVRAAVTDGVIDIVATDHAPHTDSETVLRPASKPAPSASSASRLRRPPSTPPSISHPRSSSIAWRSPPPGSVASRVTDCRWPGIAGQPGGL